MLNCYRYIAIFETVYKGMSLGSFKNVINKMCLQIIYLIYTYKQYLALNNLQNKIKII